MISFPRWSYFSPPREGTKHYAYEVGILAHITEVALPLVIVINNGGDLPCIVYSIGTGDFQFLYLDFRTSLVEKLLFLQANPT